MDRSDSHDGFYKDYIIRFQEGQQATLKYIDEKEGTLKYQTSFIDTDSLFEGEQIKLIITIEHKFLTEQETLFYRKFKKE
jgi:hypothetical protein